MTDEGTQLRVIVANERRDHLDEMVETASALGYAVAARIIDPQKGAETARDQKPDLVLVGLGESDEHALDLIAALGEAADCPIVALLDRPEPDFIAAAAERGVAAYAIDGLDDVRAAVAFALRRFENYRELELGYRRRAVIERAKGILMERHGIEEAAAYNVLRRHARNKNQRVADVASALVDTHVLLRNTPSRPTETEEQVEGHGPPSPT